MSQSTYSILESLEAKLAPAGLVTITLTTSGAMTITGDVENNEIAISNNGNGTWTIQDLVGAADTLFSINGNTAISSLATFIASSIKVDLGAGDDVFFIDGLATAGSVSVKGGSGADQLELEKCQIAGGLSLDTGIDLLGTNNLLSISNTIISGAVSLKGNNGADTVIFDTNKLYGTVTVDTGDSYDSFTSKDTAYANNVNIRMGGGNDLVAFDGRTDLAKGLNINFGTGRFELYGETSNTYFTSQGNVQIPPLFLTP
jgi:hypothetical protein